MFRLGIVTIVAGAVIAWLGIKEMRLAGVAKTAPQTISCADLGTKGPGDNAHVVMSDFLLLEHAFVYESKRGETKWEKVWIPAVPLGGAYHHQLEGLVGEDGSFPDDVPLPDDVRVIVKTDRAPSEAHLRRVADADTLQGLVVNEVESLGGDEKKLLEESYPGLDFGRVWILEHGRKPASAARRFGFLGGGLAAVVLGIFLLSAAGRSRRAASQRKGRRPTAGRPGR